MNKQRNGTGFYFVPVILVVLLLFYMLNSMERGSSLSYQAFRDMVDRGEVVSARIYQNQEVPSGQVTLEDQGGNTGRTKQRE